MEVRSPNSREIPVGPAELRRGYYNDDRASSPTGGSEAESYSEAAVGRLNQCIDEPEPQSAFAQTQNC